MYLHKIIYNWEVQNCVNLHRKQKKNMYPLHFIQHYSVQKPASLKIIDTISTLPVY